MSFTLRPFTDQDYDAIAVVANAIYTDYQMDSSGWRSWDQMFHDHGGILRRYVAIDANTHQIVGWGSVHHAIPPTNPGFHRHKFKMHLQVHPSWQRMGVGSLIFDRLLDELRSLDAWSLRSGTPADNYSPYSFLRKCGFVEIRRSWELRLLLAEPVLAPSLSCAERVRADGITITTLAEEQAIDPDCLRKLHQLYNTVSADVSALDAFTPVSFESFVVGVEQPHILLDAYFIAKDRERYVGLSNLVHWEAEPGRLSQEITGVDRAYRRRGIATALKVSAIEYGQTHGYERIDLMSDDANIGILALNERCGFRRQYCGITMEKDLK